MPPSARSMMWCYLRSHDMECDALSAHVTAQGVQTAIFYPVALPFVDAYRRLIAPTNSQRPHLPEQNIAVINFAEVSLEAGEGDGFYSDVPVLRCTG